MLKIEVRGLEGDKNHNPVQVFYGMISFDKGVLTSHINRKDRIQLFKNLLTNPIHVGIGEVDPSKEPEKWIRNVYKTSGHRLWITKAVRL